MGVENHQHDSSTTGGGGAHTTRPGGGSNPGSHIPNTLLSLLGRPGAPPKKDTILWGALSNYVGPCVVLENVLASGDHVGFRV